MKKLTSDEIKEIYQKINNFIDLNKLKNYTCFTKGAVLSEQIFKIDEEYQEFKNALNRSEDIAECLDLITASINYLLMLGITKEDFDRHIAKLESYKNEKYKK